MDLLTEAVFDKASLKAVFMAGGPGSGKSYVTRGLFGIPEGNFQITTKHDMKVVNSDSEFEYFLRKYGFETTGTNKLELDKWPKEVWDMVGAETTEDDPNLRYKGKTVQNPQGLNFLKGWNYDDFSDYLVDQDKMNYFAENFRTEKAGGGIAGIRRPWAIPPESGPMPQGGGLSSQYNRVKKLTE